LIAAQSELSGLQQIYTDNNVRVRAVQARVNELQKKLNEIGSAGTPGGSQGENSLYPSIRKLPLLGVTYADLYRQTKIQETVYELLTQQYELAKVQEAKEIPTVKVLDPAIVPTKISFPPRGVIVLLGTILGLMMAMTWILGKTQWDAVDVSDPRRVFATEVFTTVQARMPKFSRNGASAESTATGFGVGARSPTQRAKSRTRTSSKAHNCDGLGCN
jgi:G-rich domain on putative tyrosine kinase